ncbi:MAG: Holliday junction branch migration DNA helicase RuvB [Omnitrophica bacterium]|nr:Holliday junction branch migration DNA helicase RuvB [Candidatus Omnitrophota bacterium]
MKKNNKKDGKREKILCEKESEEDVILNMSLRPDRIKNFIGQKKLIENLKISLEATKKRNEPLEHILLSGPPGLGKTSLAHVIANEMNVSITATSGPAIERAGDLIGILTNLSEGDILFIDEIHRLAKVVEEFLYPAMENFQIDFIIDKGPYAKTIKFNLKRFTLVGATTRAGLLSAPLRGRFGMFYHFDFYEKEDLVKIVTRSAGILGIVIDKEGAEEIAGRSRGTPRVVNRLLRRVRDWSEVKSDGRITRKATQAALENHGVDELGLDFMDRKVIQSIHTSYNGGPVGIEALASTMNEEPDTIVDVVEPFLLKMGLLRRTPRGRQLTGLAYKHLGLKKESQKELF